MVGTYQGTTAAKASGGRTRKALPCGWLLVIFWTTSAQPRGKLVDTPYLSSCATSSAGTGSWNGCKKMTKEELGKPACVGGRIAAARPWFWFWKAVRPPRTWTPISRAMPRACGRLPPWERSATCRRIGLLYTVVPEYLFAMKAVAGRPADVDEKCGTWWRDCSIKTI